MAFWNNKDPWVYTSIKRHNEVVRRWTDDGCRGPAQTDGQICQTWKIAANEAAALVKAPYWSEHLSCEVFTVRVQKSSVHSVNVTTCDHVNFRVCVAGPAFLHRPHFLWALTY